jgi:hypothetical protein
LGNWSYDIIDDLTNPDGMLSSISNLNNFEAVHKDFAINWLLEDREDPYKGGSLFTREFGRTASYYANRTFEPEWRRTPEEILPPNRYIHLYTCKKILFTKIIHSPIYLYANLSK